MCKAFFCVKQYSKPIHILITRESRYYKKDELLVVQWQDKAAKKPVCVVTSAGKAEEVLR